MFTRALAFMLMRMYAGGVRARALPRSHVHACTRIHAHAHVRVHACTCLREHTCTRAHLRAEEDGRVEHHDADGDEANQRLSLIHI